MPNCEECRHFRPALPARVPTQTLRWLTSSPQAAVSREFERIAGEEREKKEAEASHTSGVRQKCAAHMTNHRLNLNSKAPLDPDGRKRFNRELKPTLLRFHFSEAPRSISHCALHAARSKWYLAEVKNWGESCDDYVKWNPGTPQCTTCSRYTMPTAEAAQRAEARTLMERIPNHDRNAAQFFERRAREIEEAIDPAKAQELRDAYDSRGQLHYRLDYLPWCATPCAAHAEVGGQDGCPSCEFRQPEIFNQFLHCPHHQPVPADDSRAPDERERKIDPQPRETEIDRMGMGQPRRLRARDELAQMAADAIKGALERAAEPVGRVQHRADDLVTLAFQRIRTFLRVVDGADRTGR
jgi:hypothetical protein